MTRGLCPRGGMNGCRRTTTCTKRRHVCILTLKINFFFKTLKINFVCSHLRKMIS
ncbi:hypothetical protein Sjap_005661 [Stephania japonica]|uniref:Uncharacterized protein n=1 Tax=Stephania japonica TaxID=461633 RepID=A0AAP0K620_9MAGN